MSKNFINQDWIKNAAICGVFGIIIGVLSASFYSVATYLLGLLLIILFTILIVSINQFYAVLFLICWLPFQNLILISSCGFFGLPGFIVQGALMSKEIVILLVLGYLVLIGRMRRTNLIIVDWLLLGYLLWTSLYLIIPAGFFPVASGMMSKLLSYRAAVMPIVLFFVGRFIVCTKKDIISSIKLLFFVAVIVSVFGIVQKLFLSDAFWFKAGIIEFYKLKAGDLMGRLPANFYSVFGNYRISRVGSTYSDPLAFGFANIFIIALLIALLAERSRPIFKTPLQKLGVFLVVVCAQLLTMTRAAILANIFGVGILALYLKRIRGKLIIFAIPLLLFCMFNPLTQKIYHETTSLSDASSRSHINSLKFGFANLKTQPMGYGLGMGGYVGRQYQQGLAGENLYFTIAIERGVVALSLFLLAAFAIMIFCHRNRRYVRDEPLLLVLTTTIVMATAGYLLASITTEHWQGVVSSGIYWLYAGITIQGIIKYRKEGRI